MSSVWIVSKRSILGWEPLAAFKTFASADEFCESNDPNFEDPLKQKYTIKTLSLGYWYDEDEDDMEEDEDDD